MVAHRFKDFQDIPQDEGAEDPNIPIYGSRQTSRDYPKSEWGSFLCICVSTQVVGSLQLQLFCRSQASRWIT